MFRSPRGRSLARSSAARARPAGGPRLEGLCASHFREALRTSFPTNLWCTRSASTSRAYAPRGAPQEGRPLVVALLIRGLSRRQGSTGPIAFVSSVKPACQATGIKGLFKPIDALGPRQVRAVAEGNQRATNWTIARAVTAPVTIRNGSMMPESTRLLPSLLHPAAAPRPLRRPVVDDRVGRVPVRATQAAAARMEYRWSGETRGSRAANHGPTAWMSLTTADTIQRSASPHTAPSASLWPAPGTTRRCFGPASAAKTRRE